MFQAEFFQPLLGDPGRPAVHAIAVHHGPAAGLDLFRRRQHSGRVIGIGPALRMANRCSR
ncbi:MAG: hypothetical protein ACOX30_09190 [Dethiobacteria bacterium]